MARRFAASGSAGNPRAKKDCDHGHSIAKPHLLLPFRTLPSNGLLQPTDRCVSQDQDALANPKMKKRSVRTLRIASVCSGLGVDMMALREVLPQVRRTHSVPQVQGVVVCVIL